MPLPKLGIADMVIKASTIQGGIGIVVSLSGLAWPWPTRVVLAWN
ncbi:MAG TPA: hypothetical protein VEF34_04465 [Syntrophobacteraceae bacterium]|nr:hypothetical protein [Syntrophobacteraceae bacterium]